MDLIEFLSWWRRKNLVQALQIILWVATIIELTEACSTRGAPKVRSPANNNHLPGHHSPQQQNQNFQTTTNASAIPHFNCPAAYQQWYCLNGASCFALKIGDTILYNCRCLVGFQGQRCEFKDTNEAYLYVTARYMTKQATIAGATTVSILIVIILVTAITIYVRRRRESKRAEPLPSPETVLRMPFGRTLSRTDQFSIGRQKNPSGGFFAPLVAPSTSRGFVPESETLLTRAPVASMSDTSLTGLDREETVITVEPENNNNSNSHQEQLSLPPAQQQLPFVNSTFTTGS